MKNVCARISAYVGLLLALTPALAFSEIDGESNRPSTLPMQSAKSVSACTRGEPKPILQEGGNFTIVGRGEARETTSTASRVKVRIRQFGCTHYGLEFSFTWPQSSMPAPAKAIREASDLIRRLPYKAENAKAMMAVADAAAKMAENPYKQPMTMSASEPLEAATPALNMLKLTEDVAL